MKRNQNSVERDLQESNGMEEHPYISPKELAKRWRCGRSSVDRIARKAGFTRLYLGEGRNGIVRYLIKEVMFYESSRSIVTK